MKKKILSILMAVTLSVSIIGCSSVGNTDTGSGDESAATASESGAGETDEKTDIADGTEETTETAYVIPEVTMAEYTIPDNESFEFVKNMKIGMSLGNTFDAYNDSGSLKNHMDSETCWQGVPTTEKIIQDIHDAGFETLRLPITWHNHFSDDDYTISEDWMARVHEAVDWAINDGMYVIINIHHDNHPEADCFYPDSEHLDQSKHYIERIWGQLSEEYKDYDEKLIFESMNEPRLVGSDYEWWINNASSDCKDAIACINTLNQTFVDTVRASGGNNATRYLMCPGYDASADGALNSGYQLPTDIEGNDTKIFVSVHAYTPYDFALDIKGKSHFDASKKNYTNDIDSFMDKLYKKFISQGTPVVIGEFGALAKLNVKKEQNVQDRVDYAAYYIAAARARGMTCLWWDNNAFTGDGENFGLYYRTGGYFIFEDIVDALMKYAE